MSARALATTQKPSTALAAPLRAGILQRKCACGNHTMTGGECEDCKAKKETLQRKPTGVGAGGSVPPIVHDVLRSSGRPLDTVTRRFMETRLGHDFSQVRVHTDAKSAQSSSAVNARAYTVGRDVVFGAGQYSPASGPGKGLLAHELTHVVQQDAANSHPQRLDEANAERQAELVGREITRQDPSIDLFGKTTIGLARAPAEPPKSGVEARALHQLDLDHLKELLVQLVGSAPPEIQGEIDRNRTIAVALVEMIDEQGDPFRTLLYTASGNWKQDLDSFAARLGIERLHPQPREQGKREETEAAKDAEQLFIEGQLERDMSIIGMAIYRRPCKHCAEALKQEGFQFKWLEPKERKVAAGAGRLFRRGSAGAKQALQDIDQAFSPSITAPGQESSTGLGADAPIWKSLNVLDIKELYQVLEVAQLAGRLHRLIEGAYHARGIYNDRLLAVMTTLDYKNALQAGSPQDSALLGALFNLQAQVKGLPEDQQLFLRKALLPAIRSIRKASVVKKPETKSEKGQEKKPAPKEPETSTTMGGLIAKALKVAGAVISAAIIIEVAEAAASALFTEFLLQLSEQGWKALPKEKVVEVVEREVQKRVHVPAEQLKRIGEAVVHEFEHLGDIGRSAVGGALQ